MFTLTRGASSGDDCDFLSASLYSSQTSQRSRTVTPNQNDDLPTFSDTELQAAHVGKDYIAGDADGVDVEISNLPIHAAEVDIEAWGNQELAEDAGLDDQLPSIDSQKMECVKIYRAKAKLMGNMVEVLKTLNSSRTPQVRTHFLLDAAYEEAQLYVDIPGSLRIAELNRQLNDGVAEIIKQSAVSLQVLVHKDTIISDIGSATKSKDAQTTLDINVYEPRASSSFVGQQLSKHKIWLQRPSWQESSCPCENPHVLKTGIADYYNKDRLLHHSKSDHETTDLQQSVQEVYSKLTRDQHLTGFSGDDRLAVPLYPHQKKALQFSAQREQGPIAPRFQLWEETTTEGQTWHHHKLANVKSRTAVSELGGDILADEMGLGKTLSMLALAIRSLDQANAWSIDAETYLADSISPSKRLSRATLVVVPSPLLLEVWTEENRTKLKTPLDLLVYHGVKRPTELAELVDHDIVLTTYHTLVADHNRKQNPIVDVAWYRIILDEAHFVRRASTLLHKRVAEIEAPFRWCLTGTPIQNSHDDIGALFTFLKIYPFDRLGQFRQCVTGPFRDGGERRALGQQNLTKLMDSLCLRRQKDILGLTNYEQIVQPVRLSPEDLQYRQTRYDMNKAMRHAVGISESKSRFGLFQAQLQLRLLCNHGTWQHRFHWTSARNMLGTNDEREDALAMAMAGPGAEIQCSGCRTAISDVDVASAYRFQTSSCAHVLCSECQQGAQEVCPLCVASAHRHKHSQHQKDLGQVRDGYFREIGHSSKMEALVRDLKRADASDKSIVFSHWTTTLDLICHYLGQHQFTFVRIDGKDDFKYRQKVLHRFKGEASIAVLVMTTGVGAFGLDLIAANRVFLVEPQWNPSIELQAIGRTLRIGQQKAVKVVWHLVEDSVERNILELQEGKLRMAGMAKVTDIPEHRISKIKREHLPSIHELLGDPTVLD